MRRLTAVFVCVLALGAHDAQARLKIVATTPDYGALAEAIGGDRVTVKVLAKATEDPHFVDAKPSHIVTLNRADLLIESGADLELGWLPTLVEGARNPKVLAGGPGRFQGFEGIEMLDVPAVLDRSKGDIHAKGNPHFLMDPANTSTVARRLAERFCELDRESCAVYRENLARFERTLEEKSRVWRELLEPYKGTAIVTYHNTWRYFAKRYGLRADTFLEPKPGIPPSPPHLTRTIGEMKQNGINVILVEPFQSRRTADAVAEKAGAVVVEVCQFPGGLPGTQNDYFALMDANVHAIVEALRATSTR